MRYKMSVSLFLFPVVAVRLPPTPIRLIEKYSEHEGHELEHWIDTPSPPPPPQLHHATTLRASEQEQQRVEELQRRKQERNNRQGLQKRSVAAERPVPTISSPHCEPFENVDTERKTLSSPGSPNNYPNNTDCYVVLEGN